MWYDADMKCPKCKKELATCGEMDVDGKQFIVFQCDDCVTSWEVDGERFDAALTFAVDSDGNYFDAESLEPINLN